MAAIMRLPNEDRLVIVDSRIQPYAQLVAEKRAGSNAAEGRKIRVQEMTVDHAALFVALPIRKEEDAVVAKGPARRGTKLAALKEWIGIRGVARQRGISGQRVIAKEKEGGSMQGIRSGASHDIDGARVGRSRRQIEIRGRYLKFLHHLLRKAHLGTERAHRHDAAAIHRNARSPAA